LYSHAEGGNTTTIGNYSHAEGEQTTTKGDSSHAEGLGTITGASNQSVVGKYNVEIATLAAFIVGAGTSGVGRKNGLEIYDSAGTVIVRMPNLPTSATGLPSGALWIDTAAGRVIKVVA